MQCNICIIQLRVSGGGTPIKSVNVWNQSVADSVSTIEKLQLVQSRDYDANAPNRNCNLAMLNVGRRCASAVPVSRCKGRASLAGSKDQNLATDHEGRGPSGRQQLFH